MDRYRCKMTILGICFAVSVGFAVKFPMPLMIGYAVFVGCIYLNNLVGKY